MDLSDLEGVGTVAAVAAETAEALLCARTERGVGGRLGVF